MPLAADNLPRSQRFFRRFRTLFGSVLLAWLMAALLIRRFSVSRQFMFVLAGAPEGWVYSRIGFYTLAARGRSKSAR